MGGINNNHYFFYFLAKGVSRVAGQNLKMSQISVLSFIFLRCLISLSELGENGCLLS